MSCTSKEIKKIRIDNRWEYGFLVCAVYVIVVFVCSVLVKLSPKDRPKSVEIIGGDGRGGA